MYHAPALSLSVSETKSLSGKVDHGASSDSRTKQGSSVQTLSDANQIQEEATFGGRLLTNEDDVWEHNAWDHVTPPPEYLAMVKEKLSKQAETRLTAEEQAKYHASPASYWNTFYSAHENRFFRDRHWLRLEFPELVRSTEEGAGEVTIVEVGCGAGNTVFPLLDQNKNPHLTIYACDYSAEAIEVVKSNPLCTAPPTGTCHAKVWDLSSATQPLPLLAGTADFVVLIFVLSALHPDEWRAAARNVRAMLKPGGIALVRDYGRHDLPQLRFGKGKMVDDNFYVRGDGTRVYFYTPEELASLFKASTSSVSFSTSTTTSVEEDAALVSEEGGSTASPPHPLGSTRSLPPGPVAFETLQLAVDRRLLVNRKERKRMYRVWLQAKFRKLELVEGGEGEEVLSDQAPPS